MIKYNEYLQTMDEALVTFGNKAYPKFGQVVLLAGGAASGKGFVTSKVLGIDAKVMDVDALKELVIGSKDLASMIKSETGYDINSIDLKVPENVSLMHKLINQVYGIAKKNELQLFKSISTASPERLPNVIFDVTLKDIKKLQSISKNVTELGYDKKNIHIVWVVNDIKVALKQNLSRDRVVPEKILINTHIGAANTMNNILSSGDSVKQYMDGDIWMVFNKKGVDSTKKSVVKRGKTYVIETPSYPFKVKEAGKTQIKLSDIRQDLFDKVKDYVPKIVDL